MFRLPVDEHTHLFLLEERHAVPLATAIAANRAYLAEWMPWAASSSVDSVREFIREGREAYAKGEGISCGISHEDRIAGTIGTHGIDKATRTTSVGYWLAQDLQGRGIVTRSLARLLDHLFLDLALHRVELRAATGNVRSRRLAEGMGFRMEGTLRDAGLVGGKRHDLAVYSLLSHEWRRTPDPR